MSLSEVVAHRRYMGFHRTSVSVLHVLIWTLAALIAADVVVSYIGLTWFGVTEGNPLYHLLGMGGFMLLKIAASAGAMWMMWRYRGTAMSYWNVGVLCGLYWAVLVNNLVIMGV